MDDILFLHLVSNITNTIDKQPENENHHRKTKQDRGPEAMSTYMMESYINGNYGNKKNKNSDQASTENK